MTLVDVKDVEDIYENKYHNGLADSAYKFMCDIRDLGASKNSCETQSDDKEAVNDSSESTESVPDDSKQKAKK